jgi:hypothetical protein
VERGSRFLAQLDVHAVLVQGSDQFEAAALGMGSSASHLAITRTHVLLYAMNCSDPAQIRAVPRAGAPVRHPHGCRLTTRDEAVATAEITRLRIAAGADNALIERPLKLQAKRAPLAQGHKARISCGYLRSHWRSTLEPGDDLAVRRKRARQCAVFFRALAELCDDPKHSAEEVFEEVRLSAQGFAEWADEIIRSDDPHHPLDAVLSPLRDTFVVETDTADDIPLNLRKAKWCARLVADVLEEIAGGPAVFGGHRGGGGHPAEEGRGRAPARIDRYQHNLTTGHSIHFRQ